MPNLTCRPRPTAESRRQWLRRRPDARGRCGTGCGPPAALLRRPAAVDRQRHPGDTWGRRAAPVVRCSRSVVLNTLLRWFFGKAATRRYCFGRLKRAMCCRQVASPPASAAIALEN